MEKVVDARGLSCPEPIILLSNTLKECDKFEIIVDNQAAYENIMRYVDQNKHKSSTNENGTDYHILVEK